MNCSLLLALKSIAKIAVLHSEIDVQVRIPQSAI
jgi:hypothetical protein